MRIAIYGGSFNPPHVGHLSAAKAAAAQLEPDRLLLIPAADPPHKVLSPESAGPQQRLEMVRCMAKELPGAQVSDLELCREGKSYTVLTLEQLHAKEPEAELVLLMGTDMFLSFEQWHRFERIFELATLAVFTRAQGEDTSVRCHGDYLSRQYGAKIIYVLHEPLEISSTEIREALKNRSGENWIPEDVYGYIMALRLYGAKPSFEWLRKAAYAYLKPKRIPHVRGTELEAIRLAERWGVDPEDAAEAAILHDITKKLTLDEQLLLCKKYGIITDSAEAISAKLLHSKTGAALSGALFGVSDAVYEAIRWHTTGKADMSPLEKVIYMADYIEPTRDFEGVEQLRRLAYEDLDAAMLLGLQMSLEDLRERNIPAHRNSVEAWEFFLKRKKD